MLTSNFSSNRNGYQREWVLFSIIAYSLEYAVTVIMHRTLKDNSESNYVEQLKTNQFLCYKTYPTN